jgi:Holliday junction DNA helicase RuvA
MISSLTGELKQIDDDRAHVQCGPLVYELLLPASDLIGLAVSIGTQTTFHTIFYLEGDPSRGGLEPRLIGFIRSTDKRFFELFTTVKGIGPRTALRALTAPVGEIAHAIESRDTRYLIGLKGIGKRTAELIIAELAGKVGDFAIAGKAPRGPVVTTRSRLTPDEEDAVSGLVALGERRADAERLLERAKQTNPALKNTDQLLREMLRLRGTRERTG